jgi:cell division protein FtsQ
MNQRRHGAAVSAPDESASLDETPTPKRRARTAPGKSTPPPEGPGLARATWSLMKLLLGVAIVVGAAGAVAWGAHRYALTSARFAIHAIEISGTKKKSDQDITKLLGVKVGDNIFAVDAKQLEQKLLQDPWIQQVKVSRTLPSTLRIDLVEREAGAIANIGDRLYLVTKTGEPFKELEDGDPFDLMIVTGIAADDLARDRLGAVERIATGLEIARHYERIGLSKTYPIQEVHLAPGGSASLTLGKAGITVHLGTGPWRKKLLMAERVLGRLGQKGQVPGIVFADNEAHPERVVVRMR